MFLKIILILLFYCSFGSNTVEANVVLTNSGPAVLGANVTFSAAITNHTGEKLRYIFYYFYDQPRHRREIISKESVVNCTVEFHRQKFKPGLYHFIVIVQITFDDLHWVHYAENETTVILTDLLNVNLTLHQEGIEKFDGIIEPNQTVTHTVEISDEEMQFLQKHRYIRIAWYLNCSLIALKTEINNSIALLHTYAEVGTYKLDVLIGVENERTNTTDLTDFVKMYEQDNSYTRKYLNGYSRMSSFRCMPAYDGDTTYGYTSRIIHVKRQDPVKVVLTNSGPAVLGANVTFTATVTNHPGQDLRLLFHYFYDQPYQRREIISKASVVNCSVEFSRKKFKPGVYSFGVIVQKNIEDDWVTLASDETTVVLTSLMNGNLNLYQYGIDKSNGYIQPREPIAHIVQISEEEMQFLKRQPSFRIVWYINCSVVAVETDVIYGISFLHTYSDLQTYNLEVLVSVENEETRSATNTSDPEARERLSHFQCPAKAGFETYGYYNATIHVQRQDSTKQISTSNTFTNRSVSFTTSSDYFNPTYPSVLASEANNSYWDTNTPSPYNQASSKTSPEFASTSDQYPWSIYNYTELETWNSSSERYPWNSQSSYTESVENTYWNTSRDMPRYVPVIEPWQLRNHSESELRTTSETNPRIHDDMVWNGLTAPRSTVSGARSWDSWNTTKTSSVNDSFYGSTPDPNTRNVADDYWGATESPTVRNAIADTSRLCTKETTTNIKVFFNMLLNASFNIEIPQTDDSYKYLLLKKLRFFD